MAEPIALMVGLGNPGPEYTQTRHNAGFWFIDAVARQCGVQLRHEARFHGEAARVNVSGHNLWLLKPSTFMNRSGLAVAALANFYKIAPAAILVIHDELDFDPGVLRLKEGGGHAGHNGLKDIAAQLGTPQFPRVRVGVGRAASAADKINYVLGKPPSAERHQIDDALTDLLHELPKLVAGEWDKAQMVLHGRGKAP
ncbi:MAG: aminoacyl-tRNA hydrolase [Gammaproteobacteria bacterium]|nr:aminoacyl-tRNA hydrolase [Gammaproteobacteria bacterium]